VKANEMLVEAVVHTENISSVDRKRKLSDSNETETLVVENREVAGDVIECITSRLTFEQSHVAVLHF
jgi:hypothetical protein